MSPVGFQRAETLSLAQAIQIGRQTEWDYTIVAQSPFIAEAVAKIFDSTDEVAGWKGEGYSYVLDKADMDVLCEAAARYELDDAQVRDFIIYYATFDADPPWLADLLKAKNVAKGEPA